MKKCLLLFVCMLCVWGNGVAAQEETHCLIKGFISPILGLKLYLLPNHYLYTHINVYEKNGERWFCSEVEAKQAGFRRVSNIPPKDSEFKESVVSSPPPSSPPIYSTEKVYLGASTPYSYLEIGNPTGRRTSSGSSTKPPLDMTRPVKVRGYYRKDGTYVRPHTRSYPGQGSKKE